MTTHVLTLSAATPDREFPTLKALAREIVALRAAASPCEDGSRPELALISAVMGRDALPHGSCITLRALNGRGMRAVGETLGWVFLDLGLDGLQRPGLQGKLLEEIAIAQVHADILAREANGVRLSPEEVHA